jgi:hypothetical protein
MAKRIEPVIDPETGKPVEMNPPCGGTWLRDAEGGLTPADEATARAAGLQWGDATEPASDTSADTASPTTRKSSK